MAAYLPAAWTSRAQSQQPAPSNPVLGESKQTETAQQGEKSDPDQRGTEKAPIIVKIAPSPNAEDEAAQAKKEKDAKAAAEYRVEITTWVVAFATAAQAIGLGLTIMVMVRTARRQLRAYIFVDNIALGDPSQFPTNPQKVIDINPSDGVAQTPQVGPAPIARPPGMPGVFWTIKNYGQTPAYDVVHWGFVDVLETRLEHALVVPMPSVGDPKNYVAPGSLSTKAQWYHRALTEQEMADILNGVRAIYVYGRIDYVDAFKQKRFTTYRLKYTNSVYPPIAPATFLYCQNGNEAN